MAKVEFMYEGQKIDVYCNEKDKFSKVIQKFCSKAQKNVNDLCFLYNGKIVDSVKIVKLDKNMSYGRSGDKWFYFYKATPGYENNTHKLETWEDLNGNN